MGRQRVLTVVVIYLGKISNQHKVLILNKPELNNNHNKSNSNQYRNDAISSLDYLNLTQNTAINKRAHFFPISFLLLPA